MRLGDQREEQPFETVGVILWECCSFQCAGAAFTSSKAKLCMRRSVTEGHSYIIYKQANISTQQELVKRSGETSVAMCTLRSCNLSTER